VACVLLAHGDATGWDLLEYVCLENNKDLPHLGTKQPE